MEIRKAQALLAAMGVAGLLAGCAQTKDDFSAHTRNALRTACTADAIQGLKAHVFANWTSAQIDAAAKDLDGKTATEIDAMSFDLGISKDEMTEMVEAARRHGNVLIPRVAVTSYNDANDAVTSAGRLCDGYAADIVADMQSKLKSQ